MGSENLIMQSASTANLVHDGLWMGGYPPPDFPLWEHFDCLALCAREYQVPELFPGFPTVRAKIDDGGTPMTVEEGMEAVRAAGQVIRWLSSGKKVLVTCFQGWNRSGIVCSIALCRGPAGMAPAQAVQAVRAARGPRAMRNPWFLKFLLNLCQDRGI